MRQNGGQRRVKAWWVLAAILALPSYAAGQDDVVGIPVGQRPPAVTIQDLDGNAVDLARWVGKRPVLVEFWATWCPICAELLPKIDTAHKKYGDRVDFLVVAVAVNESPNAPSRLRRHRMWRCSMPGGKWSTPAPGPIRTSRRLWKRRLTAAQRRGR